MLKVTNTQIDMLTLESYRRQCIKFLEQELRLFDIDIEKKDIRGSFDSYANLLDIRNYDDRLTLLLLLFASLAFKDKFTKPVIAKFMGESMTTEVRRKRLENALLRHTGYDAEFLHRKSWI